MSEPTAAELLAREAERAADRLRVVGPRMAARSGGEAAAVLAAVRADLQRLADLAADAEGRDRRPVPALAAHALGDQVLVLAHDAGTAGEPCAAAARDVVAGLRARI